MNAPLKCLKLVFAFAIAFAVLSQAAFAEIIYVKTNGNDNADGESWTTAYKTVSKALQAASGTTNDEIWIAAGTYKEGAPLTMINNVGIYGGFAGTEKCKKQRVSGNETILDGNNSHRVFDNDFASAISLTSTAVLDSVTITNGSSYNGSGMCNVGTWDNYSSPTIINCTFRENGASCTYGGGMYNTYANPTIINCTFSRNRADFSGGGMYNAYGNPTIINCTFHENRTSGAGAGMYNYIGANPTVTNCTFSENETADYGGGMCNANDTTATITNCTFSGNRAVNAAGMYNHHASPIITNCTFSGNRANISGGGMYNYGYSSPTIFNCIIWSNRNGGIHDDHGGYGSSAGSSKVTYSIVEGGFTGVGNSDADPRLMPLGNYGGLVPTMPVKTGSSAIASGAMQWQAPSGTTIPIEDAIGQTRNTSQACTIGAVEYNSCFVGATVTVREGMTTFAKTYAFTLEAHAASSSASYQWYKNDKMIVGATRATYTTAQDEKSAEYSCKVTSGAVSLVTVPVTITTELAKIYVSMTGNDDNDGSTWANAKASILASLDDVKDVHGGTEIWIATGIYREGRPLTMIDNVGIYGGFEGNETSKSQRVAGRNETILDGSNTHRIFINYYLSTAPLTSSAVLDTVTVTNGYTTGDGGGMYNNYASPTITNCIFRGNKAVSGGGMSNRFYSRPTIINCTFSANNVSYAGGGMENYFSDATIVNCMFSGNESSNDGGGMYNDGCYSLTVTNCTFNENKATQNGGGMYSCNGSTPTIVNCTFNANKAKIAGGMYNVNNFSASATITNCTLSGNEAITSGGGMYNDFSAQHITNCIIWGNTPDQINDTRGFAKVAYSIVEGGYIGTENINEDPLLMPLGNYGGVVETMPVLKGSSAVGAGASQSQANALLGENMVTIPTIDAIGWLRRAPCTIGAVEYNPTVYVAVLEGKNHFASTYEFTLVVSGVPFGATIQWFKDDAFVATGATYTTAQTENSANYYCKVTTGTTTIQSDLVTIKTVEPPIVFIQEEKNRFVSEYEFTLKVAGMPPDVTFQWFKNGKEIKDATDTTYTISQAERSASYYCEVTFGGTVIQSDPVTITTVGQPIMFNVYETKIAAKTSVIKSMNVTVVDNRPGSNNKKLAVPVHYRAPANVNYTILMAFNERAGVNYTNAGYGRMWSSSKEEEAYEFGGQWMTLSGETMVSELGAAQQRRYSPIGAKGSDIPVKVLYHNDDSNAPSVAFKGLATFEKDGTRIFSYTGIARGENFHPARCPVKHDKNNKQEPCKAEQGLEKDGTNGLVGYETLGNVYYPQPCYAEGESMDGASSLKPAHFYGTFTTRFNKSLTQKAGDDWEMLPGLIDEKVPTGKIK